MQNPITQIRHERYLSRAEFAVQTGISYATLSDIERGRTASISDKTAQKLAAATGILMSQFQLAYLLWKSDPEEFLLPALPPDKKRCKKCKKVKSRSEFHKNCQAKDGLQAQCKECRMERIRPYMRDYYRSTTPTPHAHTQEAVDHYERIVQQRTHRYQHGPMLPTERDGQLYSPNNKPISADGGKSNVPTLQP